MDVENRIVSLSQKDATNVEVLTGEIRGPPDGGGDIILLGRVDGKWSIVDDGVTCGWVS